ncbi:hypothetical protein [Kordia sp.]|uniref:hypothetical protein n=1 Tax=Kordia sp. TaxID=1965332 RepID=UPI003D6AF88B
MKKQKFSLQLRKQKIATLSEKKIQGGINTTNFPIASLNYVCITFQINCKSVLIACDPLPTLPSGCGPCPTTHTQTTTYTYITC